MKKNIIIVCLGVPMIILMDGTQIAG